MDASQRYTFLYSGIRIRAEQFDNVPDVYLNPIDISGLFKTLSGAIEGANISAQQFGKSIRASAGTHSMQKSIQNYTWREDIERQKAQIEDFTRGKDRIFPSMPTDTNYLEYKDEPNREQRRGFTKRRHDDQQYGPKKKRR